MGSKDGSILSTKDKDGNLITYTEYDAKPPEPIVKENGKPGINRGNISYRGRQQWKYLLFTRSLFNFCPPC